nr:MAG TPA: Epidermal growth factor receptor [Caudoviricetes sp.]
MLSESMLLTIVLLTAVAVDFLFIVGWMILFYLRNKRDERREALKRFKHADEFSENP